MKKSIIKQMVLSGMLTGIAILIGAFLHFPIFGGELYLIGLIIFLFPFLLRIDFMIISTLISVSIADVISGYPQYFWMSMIAYGSAVLIIWIFSKIKFFFFFGLLIASLTVVGIYFFLEWQTFSFGFALKDVISTSIEMTIVFVSTLIFYRPIKLLSTTLKII